MKNVLLSLVFMCFFNALGAQTITSSCSLSDTIAYKYKKDADRLALRRTFHVNTTFTDSVNVDKLLSNLYLKALIAVYNATALPARDTVIKMCNIHSVADPDMNEFYISADSNLAWMQNLRNNVSPINNTLLDNVINKYALSKKQYSAWNFTPYHTIVFKTDSNLNMLALSDLTSTVQGVYSVGPNAIPWDGPDIRDSLNPNFTQLVYSYGWSDCAVGCIYRTFWEFKVYNNCSVEYLGTYGDALPPGVSIKENFNDLKSFKIYPNPVGVKLYFEFASALTSDLKVIICNTLGQIVFAKKIEDLNKEIDVSFLKSGIYYLKVERLGGQKVFRLVKE